ncbi:MAG: cysteine-rich CWC family protein [Alphaproteobacteria bacterium]|nr:cysteine-rich CWC family protein [Alphaproteobacteria bacterium]
MVRAGGPSTPSFASGADISSETDQDPAALRALNCNACGAAFACGAMAGPEGAPCWCAALPPLRTVRPGGDCLCPACLAAALARERRASAP